MHIERPLISVYIPSYNYGRYLKKAIESVLKQTYENFELLIFDENSKDNTAEIINLFKGDSRVRAFKTEGLGLIKVANMAIREAEGKYLIRLDADDIFDEDILLVLLSRLEKNASLAFVFPDYYLIDEYDEIISLERREKVYTVNSNLDVPAHGACTLFRLDVLKEVGGYSEEFTAQDGYYIWNKILSKYKCGNVNLPLFYYRRHETNLTNQSSRILTARRQIKLNEIKDNLINNKPINVVIPCREYYDFRHNLWDLELGGKKLLEHSLDNCINSELWDNIVVACDNDDILEILKKYDDKRIKFFKRDKKETIRSIDMSQTLERIAKIYDEEFKGIMVISYVQSPFVKKEALEEAVYTTILTGADSAFTVEEITTEVYRRGSHGLVSINPPKFITSDYEVLFKDANSAFATRTANFLSGGLFGSKIANYYSIDEENMFICTEKQYKIAKSFV
jgi:glycosyltransferase involved in cell wall biosynthesis